MFIDRYLLFCDLIQLSYTKAISTMKSSLNLPVYECQIGFLNSNQIIITDEVLTQTVLLGMIDKILYFPPYGTEEA